MSPPSMIVNLFLIWEVARSDSDLEEDANSRSLMLMAEMLRAEADLRMYTLQSSVAGTRPAVSRLTKLRLVSDSTGPTAPYLLESRLRLGHNFQSTQVKFFCLFFLSKITSCSV